MPGPACFACEQPLFGSCLDARLTLQRIPCAILANAVIIPVSRHVASTGLIDDHGIGISGITVTGAVDQCPVLPGKARRVECDVASSKRRSPGHDAIVGRQCAGP